MKLDEIQVDEENQDSISNRVWSKYQNDIFDFAKNETDSAVIEAVAGSGKTTTNEEIGRRLNGPVLYAVFNKAIQMEAQARMPFNVETRTFNSLGHAAVMKNRRRKVNGSKTYGLLKLHYPKYHELHASTARLVALAKSYGLGRHNGVLDPDELQEGMISMSSDYNIDCDEKDIPLVVKMASHVLIAGSADKILEIDFNDQLWLSVLWDLPLDKYNTVLVDEAQDLSPIQHEMLSRMVTGDGRIIAVGDTHQSIYGFRGADTSSMARLRQHFKATELPLSISYRCARSVVERAQIFVPHIEAADNAIDGEVNFHVPLPPLPDFTPDDLIVCRTNAPMLKLAMRMLRARLPMRVLGTFGDNLKSFIKKFKEKDIKQFHRKLKTWYENEYDAAAALGRSSKLAWLEDRYESLLELSNGCKTVAELLDVLDTLMTPGNGPTLSTVHRAKGLEADTVWILRPDLIPSRWAPPEDQQEKNLHYVAITRAKRVLNYIDPETTP